jgi:hypothetical protein
VGVKNAHGVDHRCAGRPAFPARMVLTVSFVLSSGSVALLPPSPRGWSMRAPVGRRIAASLDARTPGVGTTRLLRPRTIWPQRPGLGVRTPDHRPNRCDRAVSYARCVRLTVARPVVTQAAPALPRPPHPGPHLVTIAKRPSGRAGMSGLCHKSEIRKSDIFSRAGIDGFWVFCPTPHDSAGRLLRRHSGARKARARYPSCLKPCGPMDSGPARWRTHPGMTEEDCRVASILTYTCTCIYIECNCI